jgi:integrase
MPAGTEIQRRDRALIAFTILTGARDGAIASFKLRHIDIDQRRLDQDAREVKTKFSKSFTTWFFPVGDDIQEIVLDWVNYLRRGSIESTGAVPARFGRFSRTPSRLRAFHTSTHIVFGKPWRYSAATPTSPASASSRLGTMDRIYT